MTALFSITNWLLFAVLWLLLTRLLVLNWARGGAILAPVFTFGLLLLAYDVLTAGIAVVLMLLFIPTLARSPLGAGLMRLIVALTDPLVDLVRRGSGGRIAGGPAIVIAVLLVIALRIASFLALRA